MQQKILDGRYELERKIGEGGMARVYIGRDLKLNRRVAVKVLHSRYSNDADFLSRFRHEAQAAAILSHPNVVDVYDVGQDGDIHYIVMEYVDGIDLKKLISREAPLPVEQAVAIAEGVALGLEAAHRVGLLHRDIKPQNIMVTPDGHVRITDFGVAKSQFSTTLTETGVTFGTVDYISPEQAQGQAATPRSDIYALGVTLYEMLTGRLPFTGDSALAVAMQHVSATPPSPRRLNPQVPPQLDALVMRALAKEPAQRFASAAEFARQLRGYRDVAQQETVINPGLPARPPEPKLAPRLAGGAPANGGIRGPMPAPRPAAVKAPPRQQGMGCGIFVIGLMIMAGVMGVVLLFSSGALDGLFGGTVARRTPQPAITSTQVTATVTVTPTATPTVVPLVTVPSLVGLAEDEALALLRQARLVAVARPPRYDDAVAEGLVLDQEVPAATQIEQGRPVTYTVSLGPNLITLPDLTRRRLDAASREAARLRLDVEVVEEPSQTITEDFVIRQSPAAGLLVQPGSAVVLYVSVGDRVRFPDVIGRQRDEAAATINGAEGMSLLFIQEQGRDKLPDFDRYAPGEVVSASLENGVGILNGQYIPRGSRIVLGVRANQ